MEPTEPSRAETDEKLRKIAERFVEALSDTLRQTQREWHPIPLLPFLMGINRGVEGTVRSWALRFTWVRKHTTYTVSIADPDDPIGMTVEPLLQPIQILPFVPLSVCIKRYQGRTTQKRWWAWEIEGRWLRDH